MTASALALVLAASIGSDSSLVRVEPDTAYRASRAAAPGELAITRAKAGGRASDVFTRSISPRLDMSSGSELVGCTNGIEVAWLWTTSDGNSPFERLRGAVFSTILPDRVTGRLDPRLIAEFDVPSPPFHPGQNVCSWTWESTGGYAPTVLGRGSRAVKGRRLSA